MKYRLTDETKIIDGKTVYRIQVVKDFVDARAWVVLLSGMILGSLMMLVYMVMLGSG